MRPSDGVRRAGLGVFKPALADLAVVVSQKAGEMHRLLADRGEIDAILRDGADKARAIARRSWPMSVGSWASSASLRRLTGRGRYETGSKGLAALG